MSFRNRIFARLDSLEVINSPPAVLREILGLLDEDESSASKLSKVILKDPGLTARILKIANSSFYGYRGQVNNIKQAIMILGQKMVKCLVLSISICNQVISNDPGKEKEYVKLWQHYLETASMAKNIAMGTDYGTEEEAYVAGLLHDFGRLFLLRYFAREIYQVNRLLKEGRYLVGAEMEVLGVDHQEIGHYIADRWNLPKSLAATMGSHHPETYEEIESLPLITKAVVLADNLSPAGAEMPENLDAAAVRVRIIDGCTEALGLDLMNIKKYYASISHEVLGSAAGMDIDLGDAIQYLSKINSEVFHLYLELVSIFRERQELSGRLLNEERLEGTLESLHIALATLSHYINNAAMNISGQCEVLSILHGKNESDKIVEKIPEMTSSIKASLRRISLVLEELSKISSMNNIDYFKDSKAIDIEKSLRQRLDASLR